MFNMCKCLTSEVKWHSNCGRYFSNLTCPPCIFNEYDNNTNGDKSNSNYNDNNNGNNNGNANNKHKNINNGNIYFCNS